MSSQMLAGGATLRFCSACCATRGGCGATGGGMHTQLCRPQPMRPVLAMLVPVASPLQVPVAQLARPSRQPVARRNDCCAENVPRAAVYTGCATLATWRLWEAQHAEDEAHVACVLLVPLDRA